MPRPGYKAMVCVSALAFLTMPARLASAAPTIDCTRNISFGTFLPLCNGTITVKGSAGSGTVNNGCHSLVGGVIRPAICNIQTTLMTAVQDARVTFTAPQVQFSNTGGQGQITLDNYLIQTAGGSQLNTYTFAATLLNPVHTFNVGGRLRFGGAEPNGTYGSSLNIVVTSIP